MKKAWEEVITMPVASRSEKPRQTGMTMVIDKNMGYNRVQDLIQTSGGYIDVVKLTFGTSAFYDEAFLKEKNALLTQANIDVMPGGTFLEVAIWQRSFESYLDKAGELGFSAIEVSDGTIEMSLTIRENAIQKAIKAGFKVFTEVGKKDPKEALPLSLVHKLIRTDMANGAAKVIVEAREAGKGVGIFDETGKIKLNEVEGIISKVEDPDCLMWEAPIKNQQQALIMRLGINVNLGNIPPDEILALEALRQGVRGDTLKQAYLFDKDWTR